VLRTHIHGDEDYGSTICLALLFSHIKLLFPLQNTVAVIDWFARALLWRFGRYPGVGLLCVYSAFACIWQVNDVDFFLVH
jgi:hypothetical protein